MNEPNPYMRQAWIMKLQSTKPPSNDSIVLMEKRDAIEIGIKGINMNLTLAEAKTVRDFLTRLIIRTQARTKAVGTEP